MKNTWERATDVAVDCFFGAILASVGGILLAVGGSILCGFLI